MKIKLITILFFALLCGNSFAQSSSTTVIELMEKSGSTAMFKQFDEIISAKIAEKKSSFEKGEDFNKFVTVMKSGFNSKNAEKYYLEYFELNTREDSLKSIIHIYESQFMQDMNKIELAASDPAKQQEQLIYFQGLKENPPSPERVQQLITLNNELGISEMTVKILQNMIITMSQGLNSVQPKDKQMSPAELEQKILSSMPANFSEQMTNQIIALSMFTYKDVSNEDLNRYIQVWQTPTGKYFTKNSLEALNYSFSKLGEIIGKSLDVFVKENQK